MDSSQKVNKRVTAHMHGQAHSTITTTNREGWEHKLHRKEANNVCSRHLGPVHENGAGNVGVEIVRLQALVSRAEEVGAFVTLLDHPASDVHNGDLQQGSQRGAPQGRAG